MAEGIGALHDVVAADQRTDVIAVGDGGRAAAVARDTGHGDAAAQLARVEALQEGRAAGIACDAAGAAAGVLVRDRHIGRAAVDAAVILIGDDAAGVGLIAARVGRLERHAAGNGQIADRALAVAEQTLIGRTLAEQIRDAVAVAVKNSGEAIVIGAAHRRPKLAAEVDVLGKHDVGVVAAGDAVDLPCDPSKLLAVLHAIPAGHALVFAGSLVGRELMRLCDGLAVPAVLNGQGDVKMQGFCLDREVGSSLLRALGLDHIVVSAGH